jgi:hypothetical protein
VLPVAAGLHFLRRARCRFLCRSAAAVRFRVSSLLLHVAAGLSRVLKRAVHAAQRWRGAGHAGARGARSRGTRKPTPRKARLRKPTLRKLRLRKPGLRKAPPRKTRASKGPPPEEEG